MTKLGRIKSGAPPAIRRPQQSPPPPPQAPADSAEEETSTGQQSASPATHEQQDAPAEEEEQESEQARRQRSTAKLANIDGTAPGDHVDLPPFSSSTLSFDAMSGLRPPSRTGVLSLQVSPNVA
ncbi:hypothetical protein JAAARDRAFT_31197 [Jaapia argillacea MUCL 33604]|uniref:Uncharacterized protein n=1 Tax=Jaapia argillacea MUCL 33604 TaxID=933084 RepID=A0A067Q3T9_9AGAM|nr:hypothetical protein JAAARDRAFT_31197 [Jaapia argillacea MUCL 33604]